MCGGAAVCWFSGTQKCVTLSTSEVEDVALADSMKKVQRRGNTKRARRDGRDAQNADGKARGWSKLAQVSVSGRSS